MSIINPHSKHKLVNITLYRYLLKLPAYERVKAIEAIGIYLKEDTSSKILVDLRVFKNIYLHIKLLYNDLKNICKFFKEINNALGGKSR